MGSGGEASSNYPFHWKFKPRSRDWGGRATPKKRFTHARIRTAPTEPQPPRAPIRSGDTASGRSESARCLFDVLFKQPRISGNGGGFSTRIQPQRLSSPQKSFTQTAHLRAATG